MNGFKYSVKYHGIAWNEKQKQCMWDVQDGISRNYLQWMRTKCAILEKL